MKKILLIGLLLCSGCDAPSQTAKPEMEQAGVIVADGVRWRVYRIFNAITVCYVVENKVTQQAAGISCL